MSVIDVATDSVIDTIRVGISPWALRYVSNHNRIYCANNVDNTVSVIDGTTNRVVANISVGNGPVALEYNPLSDRLYCANSNSGDVSVIDCATNNIVNTHRVGYGPVALSCDTIGSQVYVANLYSSSITVIQDVSGISETNSKQKPVKQKIVNQRLTLSENQNGCILNILGQKVLDLTAGDNNLNSLTSGVYFLKLNNIPSGIKVLILH